MSNAVRRPRLATAAVLLSLALATAACSGTADEPDGPSSSDGAAFELTATTPEPSGDIDSFTWANHAEPFSLDYAYAFDYPPNQILANVCESLLRWNPDLSITPALAEKYENPTPTTWVYTIRQGVTFHDGSTMDADDVVASLQRHLDPDVGSYWAGVYANVQSIDKTGDYEVTVTLKKPDSMFNQYMAVSPGTVESAETLSADGKDYGNASNGVNCTGPFAFDSWTPGESISLKRYDDYWDADLKAKSGEVKFVFIADPNTRVNAMLTGQVDGGWAPPANAYAQLKSSGAGEVYYGVNTVVTSEIVGDTSGPLGDKRVRQALLMAIDRDGIVKTAEQGFAEVAESLVSRTTWSGIPGADVDQINADLPKYEYDVAAAKALAKEAGVAGEELVIETTPAAQSADVIAAAIAQAAKDIGLKPKIKSVSPDNYGALFVDPAAREGVDLFMTSWYTSLADPMEFYGMIRTGEFSNYGAWSNAEFDAAANDALTLQLDDPARLDSIVAADKVATDELPWLPLYSAPMAVWLGDKITGVQPSIALLYYPWAAEIGAK
jgi:peptide/nickel transport system substrate-binding protein